MREFSHKERKESENLAQNIHSPLFSRDEIGRLGVLGGEWVMEKQTQSVTRAAGQVYAKWWISHQVRNDRTGRTDSGRNAQNEPNLRFAAGIAEKRTIWDSYGVINRCELRLLGALRALRGEGKTKPIWSGKKHSPAG
jgi:hypothetical protein